MPYSRTERLGLHYEMVGQGPPLLFLGGTGGDLRARPNVLDSPLARHFTLLTFDQRGQGRSDKPDQPVTMSDYARDALSLLDHVGWISCPVVGFSFGGMVAQWLALQRPRVVSRLALLSSTAGGAGGSSYPLHEVMPLPARPRAERLLALADLRRDLAWREAHPAQWENLVQATMDRLGKNDHDPAAQVGLARQLAARAGHDTFSRLARLTMPVLVAAGHYDGIAAVPAQQAMADTIPQGEIRIYEGGHWFFEQDPLAWPDITAFLQRQPVQEGAR